MERILNDYEKMKKAEEIYYRRNHKNIKPQETSIEPKVCQKTYLGSKILLELLILFLIAVTVFAVKNRDYIFAPAFLENVAKCNINLTSKIEGFFGTLSENDETNSNEIFINYSDNNITSENAETTNTETLETVETENAISFIKPIEGTVTSGFGARESVYQNVTGEHTGVDIGAEAGTIIQAAMTGTVTQVSTEGDYGNHIKISSNNVTTLYAHCQDIYVTEGQEISQGQAIGTVGSTGNSTGSHLHFEIRENDVAIDPTTKIQF